MTAALTAAWIVMLLDRDGSEIDKSERLFGLSHQFTMRQRPREQGLRLRLQNSAIAICDDLSGAFIDEDSFGKNAHHIELRSLVPTLFNNFKWDFRRHRRLLGLRLEVLSCLRWRRHRGSWGAFLYTTVGRWALFGGRHYHFFDILLITGPVVISARILTRTWTFLPGV